MLSDITVWRKSYGFSCEQKVTSFLLPNFNNSSIAPVLLVNEPLTACIKLVSTGPSAMPLYKATASYFPDLE